MGDNRNEERGMGHKSGKKARTETRKPNVGRNEEQREDRKKRKRARAGSRTTDDDKDGETVTRKEVEYERGRAFVQRGRS